MRLQASSLCCVIYGGDSEVSGENITLSIVIVMGP